MKISEAALICAVLATSPGMAQKGDGAAQKDKKETTGKPTEPPSGTGKVHVISQKDKKFNIDKIKVKAGDKIQFKNDEKDMTHNVFSLSPNNTFDIQVQEPGGSSTVEFKTKGVTEVECAIHPNMKLKVEVE